MRYISGSVAAIAVFALAAIAGAQTVQKGSDGSAPREVTAEVVLKGKTLYTSEGATGTGFILLAGQQANIHLRNDDSVAHDFVPSMLLNVPFRLSGNGTSVAAPKSEVVRVDPGQTVDLSFQVPHDGTVLILDQRGEKKTPEETTPVCYVSVDNC